MLGVDELNSQILSDTVSVVVKYDKDVTKALGALPKLVDPNAVVEDAHGHGHGHGHGHDSDHGHTSSGDDAPTNGRSAGPAPVIEDDDENDGPDGRAVRAAKDQEGRHAGTYGAPGRDAQEAARRAEELGVKPRRGELLAGQPVVRAGQEARPVVPGRPREEAT